MDNIKCSSYWNRPAAEIGIWSSLGTFLFDCGILSPMNTKAFPLSEMLIWQWNDLSAPLDALDQWLLMGGSGYQFLWLLNSCLFLLLFSVDIKFLNSCVTPWIKMNSPDPFSPIVLLLLLCGFIIVSALEPGSVDGICKSLVEPHNYACEEHLVI